MSQSAQAAQAERDWVYRPAQAPIVYNQTVQTQRWAQTRISQAQAKAIARRQVPGATVQHIFLNGNTYRVRMLKRDGRVVDVLIDATTGRVR